MERGGIGPLKSKSSRRVVPIGQGVVEEPAARLAAYPSDGALFVDEAGQSLAYRRWRSLWSAAAQDAGYTSHGLRHFFASAKISGGASMKRVQAVLGHASALITLQTYSYLWPGDDARTRDVMDAVLSAACGLSATAEAAGV